MKPALSFTGLLATLVLLSTSTASAKVEFSWSGKIQTDVRLRVLGKTVGDFYAPLDAPTGVSLNQNLLRGKLTATAGPFTGVAELDFIWRGYAAEISGISDLSNYNKIDSYFLRVQNLYIEASNIVDGLDFRIGQQQVLWGKGDQFNPTNNLNPTDLYDILLFGERLSNLMAKVDYTVKGWTLSGVLVPIFKPAVLPTTSPLGLALSDRMPMVEDALRWRLAAEKALTGDYLHYPTVVGKAVPMLPDTSFSNMQFAFRLSGSIKEHDVALSYYYGRTDFPQAYLNYSRQVVNHQCDPNSPPSQPRCIDGTLSTEAFLGYPRVQVLGLNLAGQINIDKLSRKLKPLGYRFELGVYFPQESTISLLQDQMVFGGGAIVQPSGEYDYASTKGWAGGTRPVTVRSTPFAKWTLGLDYTFNRYVYMNAQWVHGMADDYGAGDWISRGWAVRQGSVTSGAADTAACALGKDGTKCVKEILRPRLADYLVLGLDFKFLEDRALLRLFTIWDLSGYTTEQWDDKQGQRVQSTSNMFTAEGFSCVLYPEFVYNFDNGLELGLGALFQLGKDYTKFGDPAAGGSLVWTRARYSY
jgi:hypothetical protein